MLLALGLLGGLVLGPSQDPEPGAKGERTGILPLQSVGKLPKHRRSKLEKTIVKGLRLGSFDVLEPTEVAKALPDSDCKDAKCLVEVATALDARYLVRPTVEVDTSDLIFSVELFDGATGELVAHADQTCEICSDHEAETTARSLGASLGRTLEATLRSEPMLTVQSTPRGALVTIDGEEVGTTPLRVPVSPGPHQVEVSAPSRLPQVRRLELVAGVEEQLTVELERVPEATRTTPAWPGWVLIGGGIAATGAGAGLLGIHRRPIQSDCSGSNVDLDGDCRYRYNTVAGGATLTAVGVAAIATGVAVLFLNRRGPSEQRARLRPSWGGATLVF